MIDHIDFENNDDKKLIVDNYDRKITYLRISITDRCNLRCVYCMPEGGVQPLNHGEIMSYEDILRFVKILSIHGLSKVRITGGEPLVRKGVSNFIKNLNNIDGINDVSITTNGILLDEFAPELFEAGLKRINISLDSLKEDNFKRITRLGGLKKVLSGIDAVKKIGYNPIKINTVLIKGINDDEIIDFANFARNYELDLRFIEYMPIGGNISETIAGKEVIEKIQSVFKDFNPIKLGKNSSNAYSYGFNDSAGIISFINPVSEHFCGDCDRLRLTASGMLRLCLFYDSEFDIKEILKLKSDNEVFEKVLGIIKLKRYKHDFNSRVKDQSYGKMQADRSMSRIGG